MAGPGGGPPRKSHTKSRKGCETCKRRHIRCDETFPQWCPYMDMPPNDERAPTPETPDMLWTPEIESKIDLWRRSGLFPFPDLYIFLAPAPQFFKLEELRLIYHVASISSELNAFDTGSFTIWTKQIPLIGASNPFVMSALLALSATHMAWMTNCPLVNNMAFEHRGVALKGLHEAIGMFTRESSDAVLAASLLLSWQATDWRGWTQLMHGTSSVIDAMRPWEHESQFGEFIAEQTTFPTAPPSPNMSAQALTHPQQKDLDALHLAYGHLQRVESYLRENNEDLSPIMHLMTFIRGIGKVSSVHTAAQRFEMLNPLRCWLFWLPVRLLQQRGSSPCALIILAHYYTVALVVEPLFPEVGAAYFGSLSLQPIEEIARRLFSVSISQPASSNVQPPLNLMEYPIDMVTKFRSRMGWVHPERTASFPVFQDSTFDVTSDIGSNSPFVYGINPAFSYSQEHLTPMAHESSTNLTMSPLNLDPFSSQFLGIPTATDFGGFPSPASSGFGDESIAYSNQGDDEYLFEAHRRASSFGGNSSPALLLEEEASPSQGQPQRRQHRQHSPLRYSTPPQAHYQLEPSPDPNPGDKGKGRQL